MPSAAFVGTAAYPLWVTFEATSCYRSPQPNFFELSRIYNAAIWPVQMVAYVLGLLAVSGLFARGLDADRVISAVLATMWFWTGFAYHWSFFTQINSAAWLFGFIFVCQGAIFFVEGIFRHRFEFEARREMRTYVAIAFLAYAAILYPLIGIAFGHAYAQGPQFGVTPCPVTLFSFGFLLLLRRPIHWWMVLIPLGWSFIGGTAAFLLAVPQDWPLLIGGAVAFLLMLRRPILLRSRPLAPKAR